MSATRRALLPPGPETEITNPHSYSSWWVRLTQKCSHADCPRSRKGWPAWIRVTRGVTFDGRWFCGIPCLRPAVAARLQHLLTSIQSAKNRPYRLPLGLLLVNRGAISQEQLRVALQAQRESGHGRIGDWFLQLGMVTEEQLTLALGLQWGCPVFPLDRQPTNLAWSRLLPLSLLESVRAVPAHFSTDGSMLYVAFADRIDHTLLYGVEQMLGCRTAYCVSPARAIVESLDYLRRSANCEEICFDSIHDLQEMNSTICNYAEKLQSVRVSVVRAAGFVWVRLFGTRTSRDLLFRIYLQSGLVEADRFAISAKVFAESADERKDGGAKARLLA